MLVQLDGYKTTLQNRLLAWIGFVKFQALDRHYIQTIRLALITACLLLTVVSVMLLSVNPLFGLGIVGGVAGLAFVLFAYRNMQTIALMVLVASTVGTIPLPNHITLTLLLLLLMLGLWAFRLILIERSFESVLPAAPNWPVMLFSGVVLISFFWAPIYVDPQVRYLMEDGFMPRLMTLLILIISPLTTLIIANHVRTMGAFKFFVWWFIAVGFVVMVLEILGIPRPPNLNGGGQLSAIAPLLALGQLLFNRNLPRWTQALLLVVVGGWLYISVGMRISWLSGWVPLVAGIGLMVFLWSRKAAAVLVVLALIVIALNMDFVNETLEAETHESGNTRAAAGEQVIQTLEEHFLFGTGPTGYFYYLTVYVGGLFQLSHNNYLDIISQTGVVGFALFIALWLASGWMLWRLYRTVPPGGFSQGLATTLFVMYFITLLVMMLGDWVTPFTYTQTLSGLNYTVWHWMLPGVGIALYWYHRGHPQFETEAES